MQGPLLISQPPGNLALLTVPGHKGRRTRMKKFHDGHAALTWCEAHRITFIYLPAPDHSEN